jgi:hypothetical protein
MKEINGQEQANLSHEQQQSGIERLNRAPGPRDIVELEEVTFCLTEDDRRELACLWEHEDLRNSLADEMHYAAQDVVKRWKAFIKTEEFAKFAALF